ncbi:hypothetical protein PORCAN_1900 [Porphyromonas crevioricanis JCM 13913]|nr:hypothetical protein PORCAN_1900 [Porphyromonas crevioricanis JCM 13913]
MLLPESFIAFCSKLYCFLLEALLLFAESLGALDVLIRSFPEKMLSDRQKDTE